MKPSHLCLFLAVGLLPASSFAQEDRGLDISSFTCGQYIDKVIELQKTDPQAAGVLTYWVFGYASRVSNNSKITKLVYLRFNKSLAEYCKRDWNQPILKAIASVPVGN